MFQVARSIVVDSEGASTPSTATTHAAGRICPHIASPLMGGIVGANRKRWSGRSSQVAHPIAKGKPGFELLPVNRRRDHGSLGHDRSPLLGKEPPVTAASFPRARQPLSTRYCVFWRGSSCGLT
jgi:hypothetical protein